jgi:hypothetical protein
MELEVAGINVDWKFSGDDLRWGFSELREAESLRGELEVR